MADFWEGLSLAAINGVEFDIKGRVIQGGHAFGRHHYQGRRGQDTEPTGGSPLVITIVIELFQTPAQPENYPLKYNAIANVITDVGIGGQVEYIDPLFGLLAMQVSTFTLDEQAERRNGGVITITMEERSTDALDLTVPVVGARPGPRAIATGRELDAALPSAGVFDEHMISAFSTSGYPLSGAEAAYPLGSVMQNCARDSVTRMTNTAATIDYATGEVERFRARIDAMLSLPEMLVAEAWDARRALVVLADAIEQTALEVLAKGGAQATCAPPAGGTTAHAIAAKLYGDASRWQDVVSVNGQIRNPLRIGSTTSGPLRVFVPPSRTARGRFA